jgi:GTP1/Obg family GTP-binding protein
MGQAPSKPAAKAASIKNGLQSPIPSTQNLEPPLPHIGPEDAVIAVMGLTGVGKSTFISHFSDTAVVGNDLESCPYPFTQISPQPRLTHPQVPLASASTP